MRWSSKALLVVVATLAAAGSGAKPGSAGTQASWTALAEPEALTAAEEAAPAVLALARRFNPAMAFPTRDIWPTDVAYAWHDGAHLMARVVAKTGKVVREYVASAGETLSRVAWDALPEKASDGDIQYYVDAPGDDRESGGESGWLKRWRAIMQCDDDNVTTAAYPPTQYAHVFWFNRAKGLIGIQYWFYYPYNRWINSHEGDWEHVNVIVQGPGDLTDSAAYKPVGVQFFFHGFQYEPKAVIHTAGEHVMVYAGGASRFLFWGGEVSGGSYPFPAHYSDAGGKAGPVSPGDDTRKPKRFIAAQDFRVVLLPEPERLDTAKNPEHSWLRLRFYAGQWKVHGNPFILDWMGRGGPPEQPGRRSDWNAAQASPAWQGKVDPRGAKVALPAGWAPRVAAMTPPVTPQVASDARQYLPTN